MPPVKTTRIIALFAFLLFAFMMPKLFGKNSLPKQDFSPKVELYQTGVLKDSATKQIVSNTKFDRYYTGKEVLASIQKTC